MRRMLTVTRANRLNASYRDGRACPRSFLLVPSVGHGTSPSRHPRTPTHFLSRHSALCSPLPVPLGNTPPTDPANQPQVRSHPRPLPGHRHPSIFVSWLHLASRPLSPHPRCLHLPVFMGWAWPGYDMGQQAGPCLRSAGFSVWPARCSLVEKAAPWLMLGWKVGQGISLSSCPRS
jgi:hypothetical protein